VTKEDILHYLSTHKDEFYRKFNITKLALFGSYARGDATESSDIDILVEIEKDTQNIHDKKEAFRALIENALHKRVDIAREKYLKPLAREAIEKDICYV